MNVLVLTGNEAIGALIYIAQTVKFEMWLLIKLYKEKAKCIFKYVILLETSTHLNVYFFSILFV